MMGESRLSRLREEFQQQGQRLLGRRHHLGAASGPIHGRDGATGGIQDAVEGKFSLAVDKQKGVDFKSHRRT